MSGWQPIETAPKDGTPVDLWIVGPDDTVDFYTVLATKVRGRPLRHGRACLFVWHQKHGNPPNWYPLGGLTGFPLSPEVRPTHWQPLPDPPQS